MLDEEIIKSVLSKRFKKPSKFFTVIDISNHLDDNILSGYINFSVKNKNYIHIGTINAGEYQLELRKIKIRKLLNNI